jgi:hypothetical protein
MLGFIGIAMLAAAAHQSGRKNGLGASWLGQDHWVVTYNSLNSPHVLFLRTGTEAEAEAKARSLRSLGHRTIVTFQAGKYHAR